MRKNEMEANSTVACRTHWIEAARRSGKCCLCPPHGGENKKRTYGKHGPQKRRGKKPSRAA